MQTTTKNVLALDFGGTKLACAIVDTDLGKILNYTYMINSSKNAESNICEMFAMADSLLSITKGQVESVGVSYGGMVNQDGTVISDHIPGWEKINLKDVLEKKYHLPVFIENDCNAAVLGEWYYGSGKYLKDCIYIQLSTGIGCGIIIDGKLYRGNGNAGELGHICVDSSTEEKCVCGHTGCLENYLSGWGLRNRAIRYWEKVKEDSFLYVATNNTPEIVTAELIFSGAKQNDPFCKWLTDIAIQKLGLALSHIINLLDPSLIVFGGGISSDYSYFINDLKKITSSHVISGNISNCIFKKSQLKGNAPLLGAAILNIMDTTE